MKTCGEVWYDENMKIIEKKDWPQTFTYAFTCTRCESKLEADHTDLIYEASWSDQRDGEEFPERFRLKCPVCGCLREVAEEGKIPEFIQHLVRTRKAPGVRDW